MCVYRSQFGSLMSYVGDSSGFKQTLLKRAYCLENACGNLLNAMWNCYKVTSGCADSDDSSSGNDDACMETSCGTQFTACVDNAQVLYFYFIFFFIFFF